VHGDFRLDNMLFGQAEAAAPLAVVDWQTCAHGHPASDVAYFLGAGLLPDLRRREEKELLAHYHAELRAQGVDDYALESLEADYRRFSFSGLVMAVVASQIVEVSERGDAMFAAMAERHGQQIADLDAEAGLG
jgi:aminoglycoside phosphotransferase (APT) family kinase protein